MTTVTVSPLPAEALKERAQTHELYETVVKPTNSYDDHDSVAELRGPKRTSGAASAADTMDDTEGVPRDELFLKDVRVAFRAVPNVAPTWLHKYMKLLVVGEMGLGKTTFVRNLFAAYAQTTDFSIADASGNASTNLELFLDAPEKLCTEIVVKDEDRKVFYHYLIQDTPGYGDKDTPARDILHVLLDYVSANNRKFFDSEHNPGRICSMAELPDPRVDAVLFFITPHRLKEIEVDMMVEMSRHVPLVPLLAKADSMTEEELSFFRAHVRKTLSHLGKNVMHHFDNEVLDESGARRSCPPFAVVSSTAVDLNVGSFWPVRKYPWGRCETMSSRHSDVAALKRLLFEVAYEDLKSRTEERYCQFRRKYSEQLQGKGKGIQPVKLLKQVLTVAAVLWAGSQGASYLVDQVADHRAKRSVKEAAQQAANSAKATTKNVAGQAKSQADKAKPSAGGDDEEVSSTQNKSGWWPFGK